MTKLPDVAVGGADRVDREALLALAASAIHPEVASEVAAVIDLQGIDCFSVARSAGGVVGMVAILPTSVRVDETTHAAGQVEFVAVDDGWRGCGVGRRLVAATVDRSEETGVGIHIVRPLSGVYAHLGFAPLISAPPELLVPRTIPERVAAAGAQSVRVRVDPDGGPAAAIAARLLAGPAATGEVVVGERGAQWEMSAAVDHYDVLVAAPATDSDGGVAVARCYHDRLDDEVMLTDVIAADESALEVILAAAPPAARLVVQMQRHVVPPLLRGLGARVVERERLWVRTARGGLADRCARGPVAVSLF